MVRKLFVEKKKGIKDECESLKKDIMESLGIKLKALRILSRYDVENISDALFEKAVHEVFSEPPVDDVFFSLPQCEKALQISYLPGQFDQRARSAEECISFIEPESNAKVKSSRVYLIDGASDDDMKKIGAFLVNPVEAFIDTICDVSSLETEYPESPDIEIIEGFRDLSDDEIATLRQRYSLAMDEDDLKFMRNYFCTKGREPSITELRVLDTYWSDHCRHTTFLTEISGVRFENKEAEESYKRYLSLRDEIDDRKNVSLMDIATIGAKVLKKRNLLENLDESEEINACSIEVEAEIGDKKVPYLLMFKNETHNHPTEIEPFGGAATCIGGAIRDPLSGRSYVYQAARISGSGNILKSYGEKREGKLSQKKIGVTSAAGNSSYGNQIGLATGIVDEIYHPGYEAKHMELGAVVAAARKENVVRKRPEPGDVVILLGGRTGRDGIGGATGSSKSHERESVEKCSSEVQKGNAPEERKIQRLFRNPECSKLIKRCNDFGAGGVSVAIGELADGLIIDLDKIKKKYQGLDGTELAISESQERMAVVIAKEDEEKFLFLAKAENLEATRVATVTDDKKLTMIWRGRTIVDLDRDFLNSNGAKKKTEVIVESVRKEEESHSEDLTARLGSLKHCSREGLSERFDSTIGASTLLMPFGGKYQKTPSPVMAALLPDDSGKMSTASIFSYAYDPNLSDRDPYNGAKNAVYESIAKLIAAGGKRKGSYLTFQEYFGKPGKDPKRWGAPLSSLLGALDAQIETGCAAIGGKDSMSGSFENLDVPNTLVSFAINTLREDKIKSAELKSTNSFLYLVEKKECESISAYFDRAEEIIADGRTLSASTVPYGDVDVTLSKLAFGNMVGVSLSPERVKTTKSYSFIIESNGEREELSLIGKTNEGSFFGSYSLAELLLAYESTLEEVYPLSDGLKKERIPTLEYQSIEERRFSVTKKRNPLVLIPVFPGTNCEYDTKEAFERAGAECDVFIINNMDSDSLKESIESFEKHLEMANILFIPGGFSGADEPDGSGKFITAFLRNPSILSQVERLLHKRDGLVGGICNGFQALIKLGLITEGRFAELSEHSPTLTFNTILRHQSRLIRARIVSTTSSWLMHYSAGDIETVPVSHGEGRILMSTEQADKLFRNGQIATQYVDLNGYATMDIRYNVNGSVYAIEALTSPDGKVFGRMGHIERSKPELYRNVTSYDGLRFFKGAVDYFS